MKRSHRMVGARTQSISSLVPPDFDFWDSVKDLGDKANEYQEKILKDVAVQYTSTAEKINELKETMSRVVSGAEGMRTILQDVSLEEFSNRLEVELSRVFEVLKEEISEPLPEDQTERYRQQAIRISRGLDMIEEALVIVCRFSKIPEADVRMKFGHIKPHINHALLIIAGLVNKHPVLFRTLAISALIQIIPSYSILRPILMFFGFGPLGPIKGSLAAFAQSFFFGPAVTKGSWFATLQRAAM